MHRYTFWILSLLILCSACKQSSGSDERDFIPDPNKSAASSKASEVIYSLYLPTDITRLFEETGTGFNPELLIPFERLPFYEDPGQMALLIGSLGVDLSYCKLFERILESAECYKHIELLADKLDLPQEIFEKSSSDLEAYINKPDSLTVLLDKVYSDVDLYFKENHQE